MGSDIPGTRTDQGAARPNLRTLALGLVLLVLTLTLIGRWVVQHNAPPENPMHGDGEEAAAALDTALARMPTANRLPYLLQSVRDSHPGLRYAAVDALGEYHSAEAADAIEQAFGDSASTVRQRAIETLHVVDRDRGLRLLLRGLRDEDTWIRQAAITQLSSREQAKSRKAAGGPGPTEASQPTEAANPSLNSLADRRTLPMLVRALDDEDNVVTSTAVALLHRLTGRGAIYRTADGASTKQRVISEWKTWWNASSAKYPAPAEFTDVKPIRPSRSDPAPDFRLRDVSGHQIRLSDQRGRVTLLNFWGTWCPPCRIELPGLERLHQELAPRGLDIVGCAVSESNGEAGLKKWCAEHGLTYRQALSTEAIQSEYGDIHEVPISVMIDKRGQIRYRWEGERDYPTFKAAAERLLAV